MGWFAPPVLHPDYVGREYRLVDDGDGDYFVEYSDSRFDKQSIKYWVRYTLSMEYSGTVYPWTGNEKRARKIVDKLARKHYNQWFKERTKGKIIYLGRKP